MERGHVETVHPYQRMWWIPHPDWEKGQQSWITAGEAAWRTRGEAAEKLDKDGKDLDLPSWAREPENGQPLHTGERPLAEGTVGKGTEHERPVHGYARPNPERLVREKGTYKRPEEHPFFKANPLSKDNIVAAYDDATKAEKYQGRRWYPDMARLAWVLGGGDAEKGAKVLSAYSPRSGWPVNMFNAARTLARGQPLDKGEGIFMDTHTNMARDAMSGKGFDEVFKGPKTNAFARLGETGLDHPEDPLGGVVVDAHAMSVAAGHRLDTEDGGPATPIGKDPFYSYVADMYRNAAADISERDGEEISPSELQAVTWLRQQRMNDAEDRAAAAAGDRGAKGRLGLGAAMRNHWSKWENYAREHGLRTELGTTALPPAAITEAEARGDSRPVDAAEFFDTASRGRDLLNQMAEDRQDPAGLISNWDSLRTDAYQAAQESWGGVTIDPRSGEAFTPGAGQDAYALTAKTAGITSVSVPEDATEAQFDKAMDQALKRYASLLERGNHYLGVFHDDANGRIDIDPVVVVNSLADANAIGAYTHNIGGAFRFSDGNGYFPPHIKGG